MAKKYQIDIFLNVAEMEASARRAVGSLNGIDRATAQRAATVARVQAAENKAIQATMVGLDKLRAAAIRYNDAREAADRKRIAAVDAAEMKARDRSMVGLDRLRMSGIKLQDNLVRAAEKRAAAEDRLRTKQLTQEEIALQVRNRQVETFNQKRIDAAMKAAGVDRESSVAAAVGAAKQAAAIAMIATAWKMATSGVTAYNEAYEKQAQMSRDWAKGFVETREDLGELASVRDRPLDNAFVREFREFNKRTGFRPSESIRFQTEFYNAGAQYIGDEAGKHMKAGQGEKFKELVGKFAVANKIEPSVIGDLAGNILATTDFAKEGDRAAEVALGRLNAVYQIGKRGRGANPVLLQQMVKSAASMLREDREQGVMSSPEEVMTGISVMAERSPEDAEIYLRNATQALRDFSDKKAGPVLRKAGIGPNDRPFDAARKLMPVVREMAKAKGVKDVDILTDVFVDVRKVAGLSTLMGRGIEGGAIEDRLRYGKKFEGPGPAKAMIAAYQQSEAGQHRIAEAGVAARESALGEANATLATLRMQADELELTELRRASPIGAAARGVLKGFGAGFILDLSDEMLQDVQAKNLLNERIPGTANDMRGLSQFPLTREAQFRNAMGRARAIGINPLTGEALPPAEVAAARAAMDPAELAKVLDRHREALEANTAALRAGGGGPGGGVPRAQPQPNPMNGAPRPGGAARVP